MELASPLSPIKNKQFKISLEGSSPGKKPNSRGFHHQSSAMSQDYGDQKLNLDTNSRFADSAFGVPNG